MRETAFDTNLALVPAPEGAGTLGHRACQSADYAWLSIPLARGLGDAALELSFESESSVQIPLSLYAPDGSLRLSRAMEPGRGPGEQAFPLGALEPGEWRLILHKRILSEPLELRVRLIGDPAGVTGARPRPGAPFYAFEKAVPDPKPGWYSGELHLHSDNSTGRTDVAAIRRAAEACGLDFISLTDHITASHWEDIEALGAAGERPLFLRSLEIAGARGHANLHGVRSWPKPFPDDTDGALEVFMGGGICGSMEAAADYAHGEGALFCINHPLSASVPWRYEGFPMEKADLIEIASMPDGAVSFLYPTFWDRLLCAGLRITGVGSSDSHDPFQDGPWRLGRIRTWVLAPSLSREGILEGLKSGRSYAAIGDSRLDFHARVEDGEGRAGPERFEMGSTVDPGPGGTCVLSVTISRNPPGNLFVMKDGLLYDVRRIPGGAGPFTAAYRFKAGEGSGTAGGIGSRLSFVRIEFHEEIEPPRYHGMASRDQGSARLLSNPIWFPEGIHR